MTGTKPRRRCNCLNDQEVEFLAWMGVKRREGRQWNDLEHGIVSTVFAMAQARERDKRRRLKKRRGKRR